MDEGVRFTPLAAELIPDHGRLSDHMTSRNPILTAYLSSFSISCYLSSLGAVFSKSYVFRFSNSNFFSPAGHPICARFEGRTDKLGDA